jgi:phenylacetate-CoA ligase
MPEPLTDSERFPLLTDHGRQMLQRLREHPHAPRYTATSGNRLTAEYLRRVREYEARLNSEPNGWEPNQVPKWIDEFVAYCFREVPFYRRYGEPPPRFDDLPSFNRSHLAREPWAFVPDSLPLDDLIVNATSGTTGHSLTLPSHPIVSASYLPLYRNALRHFGIELKAGRRQVGSILVGYQRKSFTYASVTPDQDEAGHVKLNLHPDDWRHPDDRAKFLDDCNPEFYSGDPIAFAELMKLPLTTRPRALVSTAMMLLPGLRGQLEDHFGCPVVDVYSMNECGPIAVSVETLHATSQRYMLLQHRLYIEILDPEGDPCPPGVRGEITLTGGFNSYLPLLRYRTNDYAALEWQNGQPTLIGLEGRPPTIYRGMQGQLINNLDVTGVLKPFALSQFTFHQSVDGSLQMKIRRAAIDHDQIKAALLNLFGVRQALTIEEVDSLEGVSDKVIQYTSEVL